MMSVRKPVVPLMLIILPFLLLMLIGGGCLPSRQGDPTIADSKPQDSPSTSSYSPPSVTSVFPPSVIPAFTSSPVATLTIVTRTPVATLTTQPVVATISTDDGLFAIGSLLFQAADLQKVYSLPITVGDQPWSPDGLSLVGWNRDEDTLAIFDVSQRRLTPLVNSSAWYSSPFWSPDGRYLLYSSPSEVSEELSDISIYNIASQEETILVEGVEVHTLSGWSFDSNEVAFVRWDRLGESPHTLLEVVDVRSKSRRVVELPAIGMGRASWSPTEKNLLIFVPSFLPESQLAEEMFSYSELYLVNSETGMYERLLGPSVEPAGYFIHKFPWTSDGTSIIFSEGGVICQLLIRPRERSCFTDLAEAIENTGSVGGRYPSWSANRKWISFILQFESQYCNPIAVANADGSSLVLSDGQAGNCAVYGPVWSPREGP